MMAFLITVIVLGFFEKVNRNGEDKESEIDTRKGTSVIKELC